MMSNQTPLRGLGEFQLIQEITKSLPTGGSIVAAGDDTAVLPYTKNKYQLITTDMLIEGVHFTADTPATKIGAKALNVNISDIASMGGRPKFAVVSIGLPAGQTLGYVRKIYQGLRRSAEAFNIGIVGGDTTRSARVVINITLTGDVDKRRVIRRDGARPGHLIFTTGRLGGSLASGRHLTFKPRLAEAQYLVQSIRPSAMIDCSDGLAADLGHILKASGCGAVLYETKIPCHRNATIKQALEDGEDFELIFTVPGKRAARLMNEKHARFKFYPIGEVTDGGYWLIKTNDQKIALTPTGYNHFK